jgi:hypothetical protein
MQIVAYDNAIDIMPMQIQSNVSYIFSKRTMPKNVPRVFSFPVNS